MIKLHLFDMDNTLVGVDSDFTWKEFLVKEQLAPESALETAAKLRNARLAGKFDAAEYVKFQLAEFKGKTKPDMLKIAAKYFEEVVKPAIYQSAFDYVKQLLRSGEQVAMLTTVNSVIAYHVALYFGITDYIATVPELDGWFFTGDSVKLYPCGNAKLFYLGSLCERYNLNASEVAVYSSAVSDLPLFEIAGKQVAVNPGTILAQYAGGRSWEIADWKN